MTSTTIYEKKIANGETQSYLSEDTVDLLNALKREKRPAVGPHYVPQRQVEEFAGEEVKMVCTLTLFLLVILSLLDEVVVVVVDM